MKVSKRTTQDASGKTPEAKPRTMWNGLVEFGDKDNPPEYSCHVCHKPFTNSDPTIGVQVAVPYCPACIARGLQPVVGVEHPEVQRAIAERVQDLMQRVPRLLLEEAQSIVQQDVQSDADAGRLTATSLYHHGNAAWPPAGSVRHSRRDYSRAVTTVERRLIAAHAADVERIYQQACRDMKKLGLSFELLIAYPQHRGAAKRGKDAQ